MITEIKSTNFSFYFNSARWAGFVEQFDLWGMHCIRSRKAFTTYADLIGLINETETDLGFTRCVFVYEWCIFIQIPFFFFWFL